MLICDAFLFLSQMKTSFEQVTGEIISFGVELRKQTEDMLKRLTQLELKMAAMLLRADIPRPEMDP